MCVEVFGEQTVNDLLIQSDGPAGHASIIANPCSAHTQKETAKRTRDAATGPPAASPRAAALTGTALAALLSLGAGLAEAMFLGAATMAVAPAPMCAMVPPAAAGVVPVMFIAMPAGAVLLAMVALSSFQPVIFGFGWRLELMPAIQIDTARLASVSPALG